jgi:hypothetical protein
VTPERRSGLSRLAHNDTMSKFNVPESGLANIFTPCHVEHFDYPPRFLHAFASSW